MAAIQAPGRARGGIVGINITPFVDVVLVLLIIMMVSATYIVSQSLKVELPRTATSDDTVSKTHVVSITKDGELSYNERPISPAALATELEAAQRQTSVNLVISADKAAVHGRVVEVIDVAKLAGITKFAINVERSQGK